MVGREGFEPPKSETSGLQPDPFDHFGTDPLAGILADFAYFSREILVICCNFLQQIWHF